MLLRFTVENALCFGPEASLSLVATNDDRHPSHVCQSRGSRPGILRVAALYGANGHGKTNFVRAIAALKDLVDEQKWSLPRFKLNPEGIQSPTKMIIEFRYREFDYEYGVVVDGKVVAEEWLFRTTQNGKETKLFERVSTKTTRGFVTTLSPGNCLKKENSPVENIKMDKYLEILSTGLKETRPLLSEAGERELPLLEAAYQWIVNILTPVTATSSYTPLFDRMGSDKEFRVFLENFLKRCDVGIESLSLNSTKIDPNLYANISNNLKKTVGDLEEDKSIHIQGNDGVSMVIERDEGGDIVVRNMAAIRRDSAGQSVDFSFEEESSGTRRLLDLAPMLLEPSDERVFVVDELDRKLHPMLSYKFVSEFLANQRGQLILTTHNTHLMDLDLLRRDEIWFLQKRKDGSSDLYSLAEMKVRPDVNVEKGYISGRFGAIPFLGKFPELNEH